jgi:glycosyltransferase involved in cell wall biosynthesis
MTERAPDRRQTVWIINPYGSLPSESWATYRSTMLAECLARHGYDVTQFISNFEHRSKTFRSPGHDVRQVNPHYRIHIVPSSRYDAHISVARVRYERTFARNVLSAAAAEPRPDFIVLAEPALCYYDILLRPLIRDGKSALVIDIIDIWPELFELVVPRSLRALSGVLLAPLYYWRQRLYRYPKAVVAVAEDYLNLARRLATQPGVVFETVYWGYDDKAAAENVADDGRVSALAASKPADEAWIVYAGTLGENYDIGAIIEAAARLSRSLDGRARFKVLIAGDGPLKSRCESIANPNVVFLGRLGASALRRLYPQCDVALSTYKGESTVAMPIKAFDYLFHGLPIVNSLGRDIGALVRDRHVGLNYVAGSPASLGEAIERLVLDRPLREQCAQNAAALAIEFSAERQYAKFVDVLRRIS